MVLEGRRKYYCVGERLWRLLCEIWPCFCYSPALASIPSLPCPFATDHPGGLPPVTTMGSPSARR
jgi:hypothetical protein